MQLVFSPQGDGLHGLPGFCRFRLYLWLCKVRVLWEEEHEVRDIVKHIIKLKVTCTLKSALHSCRLSTQCQSGPGSPQVLTKKRKYIQRWR